MKSTDIRNLSKDEMQEELKNKTEELFNLRFQHATNQLENTSRIKQTRQDIARVKTIIKEKEMEMVA
ncbi:MAG: 50S ribosomal protein L29 [Candidatus Magnetomorum sp.]|nr:50S ribosomal protein L29 [Candidatus Magnetomorum sp.]